MLIRRRRKKENKLKKLTGILQKVLMDAIFLRITSATVT